MLILIHFHIQLMKASRIDIHIHIHILKIQVSKMTSPQPQLLSLLEKAANPLKEFTMSAKVNGVFAPPEQWKNTDQANPNTFTYTVSILANEYQGGKIQPRKLTQKEQKQLQQKNKKGGKKESKQEEKPVQEEDPEEAQRKRLQWQALSEQQKFYRTSQDPYKAFSLLFSENSKTLTFNEQQIMDLDSKIDNNEVDIVLTRKPNMSKEQQQKLIKSKPKNLNLAELYAAKYRGAVDMKKFQQPGCTNFCQRIKLQFSGELPEGMVKIQPKQCYIFISLQSTQPLTPQVKEIRPTIPQILPDFTASGAQKMSGIQKLKLEIVRSIKAISQEYYACFSKDKQHQDDKKFSSLGSVSTLRLNEINKKKEAFLNEFVNSGKFTMLKNRISQSIKTVVIDKFRKQKSNGPISRQKVNSTLSQLNLFFQQEFTRSIDEFMLTDNHLIHEDLVLGHENSRQTRKQIVAPIINETQEEKQLRLASQYEILHMNDKAQENYVNIVLINNYSLQSKETYANFCLKNKHFDQAFVIYEEIAKQSNSFSHKLNLAALMVQRRRTSSALQLLTCLIQSDQAKIDDKILCNLLLSFMYERQNDIKQCEKYLALAERYYKIKQNPHLKLNPIQNPYQQPKPKVPKPQRYTSQLTHSQSQQIRLSFITLLSNLNVVDMIGQYLNKLQQSQFKEILQIQIQVFYEQYDNALAKMDALLKKADNIKNIDLLMMKADICFKDDKMFECQEIFLKILQLKPPASRIINIYLRLGYTYLNRKSWQDAKKIFEKACEHKYNCSIAWQGLGIANINLRLYKEAEQALNLTKIYNPLTQQVQQYESQIHEYYKTQNDKVYPNKYETQA